jgi:serine/threonine protein kinase
MENKQPIAHRDIKSRNILVSSSGECVIGDLGLALRLDDFHRQKMEINGIGIKIDNPLEKKIGTTRYMPPEVLTGKGYKNWNHV